MNEDKFDSVDKEVSVDLAPQDVYRIIVAASAGSLIEWYDFFCFGAMSTVIASKFYNTGTASGDTIAWLASFAVGFLIRPFGAIVFGVIGDLMGRKHTFLICLILMGLSTTLVGVLPTIDQIGTAASILLIILRITQGLAIGGEYGGAASYIAESCPSKQRGYYTSFLQITATLGLLISLAIIMIVKSICSSFNEEAFDQWGWRIPFLLSAVLIVLSFYIRRKMHESPVYLRGKKRQKAKLHGKPSVNPLVESFTNPRNLYYVLVSLFGVVMGMAVIWYTAQFYTLTFLQANLGVSMSQSYSIVAVALTLAAPFFIYFGYLSDKFGRKPIMLAGQVFGSVLLYPLFMGLEYYGPFIGNIKNNIKNESFSPTMLTFLVFLQVVFAAMCYSPLAAFLVELFPTSVRYTSLSVPYHIGAGVFGGLVPVLGLSITTVTGNSLGGTYFPIAISAVCAIIMYFFVPETLGADIEAD